MRKQGRLNQQYWKYPFEPSHSVVCVRINSKGWPDVRISDVRNGEREESEMTVSDSREAKVSRFQDAIDGFMSEPSPSQPDRILLEQLMVGDER